MTGVAVCSIPDPQSVRQNFRRTSYDRTAGQAGPDRRYERVESGPRHPYPGYRSRVSEAEIDEALARRGAVLIEGVRWCGKTWAALRFARSSLRLDDEDALVIAQADPAAAQADEAPRLVDEWQNAPHLWNRIRRECEKSDTRPCSIPEGVNSTGAFVSPARHALGVDGPRPRQPGSRTLG